MFKLFILLLMLLTYSVQGVAGDDAGNGGFTDLRGKELLHAASSDLLREVENTHFYMFDNYPERRKILLSALAYENMQLLSTQIRERNGRSLMMDYSISSMTLIIYKDFFVTYAGVTNSTFFEALKDVKMLLLHEASHLWGYDENRANSFATEFLQFITQGENGQPQDCVTCTKRDGTIGCVVPKITQHISTKLKQDLTGHLIFAVPESVKQKCLENGFVDRLKAQLNSNEDFISTETKIISFELKKSCFVWSGTLWGMYENDCYVAKKTSCWIRFRRTRLQCL